jgi:nitroimidazol reductase NimA-like FMN-containing flavoprotein (pyridoxamine 5'-phosphate oxidase superfamily)
MPASTEPDIEQLPDEECWALLASTQLGRLAVVADDGVDIFPVNFVVKDHLVFFSSAPGSKLMDITEQSQVAFEADGIANRHRWSVVIKGSARRLALDSEIEESGVRGLHTLSPTDKWNYVRITPATVTGRRFRSTRRRSPAGR